MRHNRRLARARTTGAAHVAAPSIGRSVHYHPKNDEVIVAGAYYSEPCSATITRVRADGRVDLTILPPLALPFTVADVPFSPTPTSGCWSWPAFVPPGAQDDPRT